MYYQEKNDLACVAALAMFSGFLLMLKMSDLILSVLFSKQIFLLMCTREDCCFYFYLSDSFASSEPAGGLTGTLINFHGFRRYKM